MKLGRVSFLIVFLVGVAVGFQCAKISFWKGYRCKDVVFAGPHTFTLKGTITYPRALYKERYPGILFCHGLLPKGGDTKLYRYIAKRLARKGYLVLTFDMRGFGNSREVTNFRVPEEVNFLADTNAALNYMIEKLPVGRNNITIMGHSLGANLAFAAGARDARVKNIVAISAGNFGDPDKYSNARKEKFMKKFSMVLGSKISGRYLYYLVKPLDMSQYLPLPPDKRVLIVLADGDWPNIKAYSERLYDDLAVDKELVIMPDSNHNFGAEYSAGDKIIDPHAARRLVRCIDAWLRRSE